MLRRPLTLTLTGVSTAALVAVAFLVPTPYAEMSPGPTYDTLGSYAAQWQRYDATLKRPPATISGVSAAETAQAQAG